MHYAGARLHRRLTDLILQGIGPDASASARTHAPPHLSPSGSPSRSKPEDLETSLWAFHHALASGIDRSLVHVRSGPAHVHTEVNPTVVGVVPVDVEPGEGPALSGTAACQKQPYRVTGRLEEPAAQQIGQSRLVRRVHGVDEAIHRPPRARIVLGVHACGRVLGGRGG